MPGEKFGLIRIVVFEVVYRHDLLNYIEARQNKKKWDLKLDTSVRFGQALRVGRRGSR